MFAARKMPRVKTVRLLALISRRCELAAARRDEEGIERYEKLLRIVMNLSYLEEVHSPRKYMLQTDYDGLVSVWTAIRAKRRPGAFMRFLGFPPFVFDVIMKAVLELYPERDSTRWCRRGRKYRFDAADCVAIALYHYTTNGRGLQMCNVFCAGPSVMLDTLGHARRMVAAAVVTMPSARVEYPPASEMELMDAAVQLQHGVVPIPMARPIMGYVGGEGGEENSCG